MPSRQYEVFHILIGPKHSLLFTPRLSNLLCILQKQLRLLASSSPFLTKSPKIKRLEKALMRHNNCDAICE